MPNRTPRGRGEAGCTFNPRRSLGGRLAEAVAAVAEPLESRERNGLVGPGKSRAAPPLSAAGRGCPRVASDLPSGEGGLLRS